MMMVYKKRLCDSCKTNYYYFQMTKHDETDCFISWGVERVYEEENCGKISL